jgi:hypothetical protein
MQELPYGNENTNESEHKYKSAGYCRRLINCDLQRFALKPKPRKILKALLALLGLRGKLHNVDTIFGALQACNHCPERLPITISSAYPLKPRRAALLRKAFKIFLVVRLIGNCCS